MEQKVIQVLSTSLKNYLQIGFWTNNAEENPIRIYFTHDSLLGYILFAITCLPLRLDSLEGLKQ